MNWPPQTQLVVKKKDAERKKGDKIDMIQNKEMAKITTEAIKVRIELGTSRTQSKNYTTKPMGQHGQSAKTSTREISLG